MKNGTTGFIRRPGLILAAMTFAVMAGCVSNPVNTPKGDYYALDAKVTAADAAVLNFETTCKASPVTSAYCTPANLQKIAQATTALGTAMDGYSAAVRDPNASAGGMQQAAAIVNAALATVTALLAQFGGTP